MKNINPQTELEKNPKLSIDDKYEPYEIIYADARDEEIHLKFLDRTHLSVHMARWFLDLEYNQMIWSDGIYEILELDPREYGANYHNFIETVHPDDRKLKNDVLQNLLKTSKPIEVNYRLLFSDGRIKWINEICNTDYQEGHAIRSYGTLQDITKFKFNEEIFNQKEETFKLMIESIPSGIAVCQANKFVFINTAGTRMLGGNSIKQFEGKPIAKFLRNESKRSVLKKIKSVYQSNTEQSFEEKLNRKNGSWFDAEITLNLTRYKGSPAVQLIINDITDRKRNEELLKENEIRLKELVATKDKFFSIIAHDLRSPFNSILGILDLLQSQYKEYDDTEKIKFLKLIDIDAKKTLKLLDHLLEWAKSQTGKISFHPSYQKLLPVIKNVAETLKSSLDLKMLKLRIYVPVEMEVFADTNMFESIFQNLLSNAIKYSFKGGTISVTAQINNNQLEVCVSDTGVGMSDETKNRLFKIEEHITKSGTADKKAVV